MNSREIIIALVSLLVGKPVLDFIVSIRRERIDKGNAIATGANVTVATMQEAMTALRNEANSIRQSAHREIEELRAEHRREIEELNKRHHAELQECNNRIQELRSDRDELRAEISSLRARMNREAREQ